MKKLTRVQLEAFLKEHATTETVLEIGGGRAQKNHSYETYFPHRVTVDIDPLRQPDMVGDAHALPFGDSEFTTILCTEVLEHLHSPWLAVAEMKRVLQPGGTLILTTRFVFPIHDTPHDYYRYTEYGLRHLFKEWEIIECRTELPTFSTLGALFQRIGLQTTLKGGKLTKLGIYSAAYILSHLNWLIKAEYGNIKRTVEQKDIFTTGYYLVAKR